jgi:hypothetical protein
MATGQNIQAVDYNIIRNKINLVMGTGVGTTGYGQTVYSADVAQSQDITAQQWNLLRFDIFNARVHQDGTSPSITTVNTGSLISFGSAHPNNQYNTQADLSTANRFSIGPGQFTIDAGTSVNRTTNWSNSVTCTCTLTFGSANQARWFFNSGGKLRFNSSRTGGTDSPQNANWSSLLSSAGTVEFGGILPAVNFYSLTNSPQVFYTISSSGVYAGNTYTLSAQCNFSNNSNGGATVVQFIATWQDPYAYTGSGSPNPPDLVSGTLTFQVSELRASGVLQNGTSTPGVFSITRPVYSITAITGS